MNSERAPYVGVDLAEVERLRSAVTRWGDQFLSRVFTDSELAYCAGRLPQLTARFAAKEAMAKALGTGIRGFGWRDIEVVSSADGRPTILLHGRAADRGQLLNISRIAVSLSHSAGQAIAVIVAT